MNALTEYNWQAILSVVAIIISIVVLIYSNRFSNKTIRLSIQQSINEKMLEKANDVNSIWDEENNIDYSLMGIPSNLYYYKTISEIIISLQILDTTLLVYHDNYKKLNKYKLQFQKLFWIQLNTTLRQWIQNESKKTAMTNSTNRVYGKQIEDLYSVFIMHF